MWRMLIANTRLPQIYEGDLNAMIGSCRVGEERLKSVVENMVSTPFWTR